YRAAAPYLADGLSGNNLDPLYTIPAPRPFSIDGSAFFQASSWDRVVVEGMNYSPGFLGCAGWGWPITVAAVIAAMFAIYLEAPSGLYADWRRIWPPLLGCAGV